MTPPRIQHHVPQTPRPWGAGERGRHPHRRCRQALLAAVLLLCAVAAQAVQTRGTGRAPGDEADCRATALSEALRDAVRRGAGVDVAAMARTTDAVLDFDQVLTSAVGMVRSYRVLDSGFDEMGDYVVHISADVVPGTPDLQQKRLVRVLIRMKGSPRLGISAEERVNGSLSPRPASAGVLAAHALDLGFQVVDSGRGTAEAVGNRADLLLRADIQADVGESRSASGIPLRDTSLSLDLAALRTGSGETVARMAPASVRLSSSAPNPAGAAAEALRRCLNDGQTDAFFRQLLARWIVELDLGRLVRVKLPGIDRRACEDALERLRTSHGIGGAFLRSWSDTEGGLADVESRLSSVALASRIEALTNGTVERQRDGVLVVRVQRGGAATVPPAATSNSAARLIPWLLIVAGVALVAGAAAWILARRRTTKP